MPSLSLRCATALASFAVACAAPPRSMPLADPAAGSPALESLAVLRRDQPVRAPAIGTSRLILGLDQLDEDFWAPIDRHAVLGFESEYENTDDWVGFEWGAAISSNDETESVDTPSPGSEIQTDLDFYEVYVGLHRSLMRGSAFRPYLGAGVSLIYYNADKKLREPGQPQVQDDRDDLTWGFYVHGGIAVQIWENTQLGLDLRALTGSDVNGLFGDGDVDYQRLSLFIGFGG